MLALADGEAGLRAPLVAGHPILRAEVVYSIRHEMAATIEDVLARRVGLQFHDWHAAIAAAPTVAGYLASAYEWSADQEAEAIKTYTGRLEAMIERAGLNRA